MYDKGRFLTFEGIDGAGKTTAILELAEYLRQLGLDVLILREPGGTEIGEQIRNLLLEQRNEAMSDKCELLLFAAARAELTETVIKPAIEAGQVVICDRFTDSTVAYQGFGRGLSEEMVSQLNRIATGGLEAQRTFYMDLTVEVAGQRLANRSDKAEDRLDQEGMDFQRKVREGYLSQAEKYPERIYTVDADRDTEAIVDEMLNVLKEDWKL